MLIYFWKGDRAQVGQRERETQNLKQAPGSELSAQSPMRGSNPQTVRSWPEPKSDAQLTEPPRRPYVYLFLRERERGKECKQGRSRERRRHRIRNRLQAPSCQHRAGCGARTDKPRDHDLSWSQTLNRLSHPGAPEFDLLNDLVWNFLSSI